MVIIMVEVAVVTQIILTVTGETDVAGDLIVARNVKNGTADLITDVPIVDPGCMHL